MTNSPKRRLRGYPSNSGIQYLSGLVILLSVLLSGCSSAFPASTSTEAEAQESAASSRLTANPSAVSFGSTTQIGVSQKKTITFTNQSTVPLMIRSVQVIDSPAFSVQPEKIW